MLAFKVLLISSIIAIFQQQSLAGNLERTKDTNDYLDVLPEDCGKGLSSGDDFGSKSKIYNGYKAKLGQFPSFVTLTIRTREGHFRCGGTIISGTHILTARHCLENSIDVAASPKIKIPLHQMDLEHSPYHAKRLCLPGGALDPDFDIAIIKLKKSITFNKNVQPACLPDRPIRRSQQAYSIGMGKLFQTTEDSVDDNGHPMATELQVVAVKEKPCPAIFASPTAICFLHSGKKNAGVSQGDSGGPVLAMADGRQTVFGVFSRGLIKNTDSEAGSISRRIYTNGDVFKLRELILELLSWCD